MNAEITNQDRARAGRAMLAFQRSDRAALDLVLDEAQAIPGGPAALFFAITETALTMATLLSPSDAEAQLERAVFDLATTNDTST